MFKAFQVFSPYSRGINEHTYEMNSMIKTKLMQFTQNIWRNASAENHALIRARYYAQLWKDMSKNKNREIMLDVGAGDLTNSSVFGSHFLSTLALDVKIAIGDVNKVRKSVPGLNVFIGDAQKLPFKDNTFDTVTLISLIEHVKNTQSALLEAIRILKPGGELVIQVQNKYFPFESHTGLFGLYYMPGFCRRWLLEKLGYHFYFEAVPGLPTLTEIKKSLKGTAQCQSISTVVLPHEIIPAKVRGIYKMAVKTRVVKIIPQSWLVIFSKL
jgi:ubiquinone/menaquinone biosynthesis C-methylase UbiE